MNYLDYVGQKVPWEHKDGCTVIYTDEFDVLVSHREELTTREVHLFLDGFLSGHNTGECVGRSNAHSEMRQTIDRGQEDLRSRVELLERREQRRIWYARKPAVEIPDELLALVPDDRPQKPDKHVEAFCRAVVKLDKAYSQCGSQAEGSSARHALYVAARNVVGLEGRLSEAVDRFFGRT